MQVSRLFWLLPAFNLGVLALELAYQASGGKRERLRERKSERERERESKRERERERERERDQMCGPSFSESAAETLTVLSPQSTSRERRQAAWGGTNPPPPHLNLCRHLPSLPPSFPLLSSPPLPPPPSHTQSPIQLLLPGEGWDAPCHLPASSSSEASLPCSLPQILGLCKFRGSGKSH
jgi:hypothetical protein